MRKSVFHPADFRLVLTLPFDLSARTMLMAKRRMTAMFFWRRGRFGSATGRL